MPGCSHFRLPAVRLFAPLLLLGACTQQISEERVVVEAPAAEDSLTPSGYLFQAETTIQDEWFHMRMRGQTDYHLTIFQETLAIRARGRDSASGLIRSVDVDLQSCPELEWAWAATQVQRSVDLREKEGEDVAASLFLLFGDPGLYSDPDPVPTLRYVWTTDHVERDEVIDNPYLPGIVKSIAVRVTRTAATPGPSASGLAGWQVERRDVLADFRRAFGSAPEQGLSAIAIFSDNDQTGEPVEAYYGWARMHCIEGPDEALSDEVW